MVQQLACQLAAVMRSSSLYKQQQQEQHPVMPHQPQLLRCALAAMLRHPSRPASRHLCRTQSLSDNWVSCSHSSLSACYSVPGQAQAGVRHLKTNSTLWKTSLGRKAVQGTFQCKQGA